MMNDNFPNTPTPSNDDIARKLSKVAEQTQANGQFAVELGEKLRRTHQPRAYWFTQFSPALRWVALMALLILVLSWSIKSLIPVPQPSGNGTPNGFVCPVTQPNGSLPPGTQSAPDTTDPNLYGNGQLWTVLKPGGKVYLFPESQRPDGSVEMVWPWYLGVEGPLTIEGHRLDADAGPLQYELAEPFNNFQSSTLILPSTGCWEITGHVGDASLTFITEVIVDAGLSTPTPITTPNQVISGTATAIVEGGYDWRGSKLYMAVPLPQSPEQVNLYTLQEEQPATVEMALAKAAQFGVQGEVFEVPGNPGVQPGYMVTDGRQRIDVVSNTDFAYYPDYAAYSYMTGSRNITEEQARTIIDTFLKSHGMDFPYHLENPHLNPGMYYVLPTTPEGMPVYHDYNMPARLEFTIDENGQVILVSSYQVEYEAVGPYGIRPAGEAFEQVLAQSNGMENGVLEIVRSGGLSEAAFWRRTYPDNQTITIYGQPAFYPNAQAGGTMYAAIGIFPAAGNTTGIENIDSTTYIEATGQFITENGGRKFNIESWKVSDALETYATGTIRREGDQVILTAEGGGGEFVIEDAPADLPLNLPPDSLFSAHGFLKNGQFQWDTIDYYPPGSGGGGGGGSGTGFYKLNLSGTPVPFPTPTPISVTAPGNLEYTVKDGDTIAAIADSYGLSPEQIFQANDMQDGDSLLPGTVITLPVAGSSAEPYAYTVVEGDTCGSIASSFDISIRSLVAENNLSENCVIVVGDVLKIPAASSSFYKIGQRIEAIRGILMVTIYKQADGSQRTEYLLYPKPDEAPFYFATLYGSDVQKLEAYHNRPVDIWGEVSGIDPNGMPQIGLERYEIPYPDLQFQTMTGRQKAAEVEGERVALFTAQDGTTYVQLTSNGFPDITMPATEGSDVFLQTLAIPGETFGGYPALRVFDGAPAVNPQDGQPTDFTGSADKFNIVDESVQPGMESYVPPDLTIERVELVYYVPDPQTSRQGSTPGPHYLQPAWRFFGHYSDGSEVEFLVQALKQEFLLPELVPYSGPG